MASAQAIAPTTMVVVERQEMVRQLHAQPALADQFLRHMLTRNIRIEEDLIDQLFNTSEKRLARTLLLARFQPDASHRAVPRVSQETLAEMVGTTRSRVNFFMNKFRKLGFIEYNGVFEDQQLAAERCLARLTAGLAPTRQDTCVRFSTAWRRFAGNAGRQQHRQWTGE